MNNNKTIFISNGKVVSKDNSNNSSTLFNNIADPTINIPNGGIDGFRNGANGASSCTECGGTIGQSECEACADCGCEIPDNPNLPEWTITYDSCNVMNGVCDLSGVEFNGVGADMGIQWAPGYLASVQGCTLLLQVAYGDPNGTGVYWRLFKCSGSSWIDVSQQAFVSDGANFSNGAWCINGDCEGNPPWESPSCNPI